MKSNYYTNFLKQMVKRYKVCSRKGKAVEDYMYSKDTGAMHCNECGNPVVFDDISRVMIHDFEG